MTLTALAFAAGAALLQQQAQLPRGSSSSIGRPWRKRRAATIKAAYCAWQAAALRCCSPKISSASPRAKSFKPTSFLARMCCWHGGRTSAEFIQAMAPAPAGGAGRTPQPLRPSEPGSSGPRSRGEGANPAHRSGRRRLGSPRDDAHPSADGAASLGAVLATMIARILRDLSANPHQKRGESWPRRKATPSIASPK